MGVREIKENEFDSVIKSGKVVVDCFAEWCGPCKMLSPIVDEIASDRSDVTFYKLNVDDAESVPQRYGIMSIPTLLIFENGELKTKSVGFKSKSELEDMLK